MNKTYKYDNTFNRIHWNSSLNNLVGLLMFLQQKGLISYDVNYKNLASLFTWNDGEPLTPDQIRRTKSKLLNESIMYKMTENLRIETKQLMDSMF